MSARTVLYLHSSSGRYGADRQLRLISGGLDRERFVPLVVLPGEGPLVGDLQADGIEVLVRPLGVIRRELANPRGVAALATRAGRDAVSLGGMIRRRQVSLVHSNTSVVLGGAAAAALARVPHVWQVRELYSRFPRAWPAYRRVLESADALICISQAAASQFDRRGAIQVIPDGLAAGVSRPPREHARTQLGLPPEVPVIAVVGRLSELKGQHVLVRALAERQLAELGAIGLLAGEPWPGAEDRLTRVLELAAALGVQNRLRLVGFRSDVQTVYGAADVLAVPSTEPEGLGGVAIEAAAAGCAVVASADGGLTEIISDGVTGRLVAPGDPAALATAAAELISDPRGRERLGREAAEDVRRRFCATRVLEATQALYDSVLAARR